MQHLSVRELVTIGELKKGRYPFCISYRQGRHADGSPRRRREYFQTRKEAMVAAREKKIELLDEGGAEDDISTPERRAVIAARDAFDRLPPRADGRQHTLALAVDFYTQHCLRIQKAAITRDFADSYVLRKETVGMSHRHIKDLRCRLDAFCSVFGGLELREIGAPEIEKWLAGLGLSNQSLLNYRRVVSGMFRAAEKEGYVEANPAASIPVGKVHFHGETIRPEEMRALLAAANPKVVPMLAIGGFAGLREAEVGRLDWRDIRLGEKVIVLGSHITKTSRRRVVEMPNNLVEWLTPHSRAEGRVVAPNARWLVEAARRKAGFGKPGTESKAEKSAGIMLRGWPTNALRHSAASYRLASTRDLAATALWLGNSPAVVERHYKSLVTADDAAKWWNIRPEQPQS